MSWLKELSKQSACGCVEVLTTERTGNRFGYRLVGASAGPQIVVAGTCSSAEKVFDRMLSIPTLPWMRGNLILVRLDALDDFVGEISALKPFGKIDRTLILPWTSDEETSDLFTRRSYHKVLRACADLGKIAGRGVARMGEDK